MEQSYRFPPFRLDERTGKLWEGSRALPLRPKTFALLNYLVARAGQLVSKHELLSSLWPDVIVGDAALTVCVHEVRDVLRDDPQAPRFIETTHRRGYRFIAAVTFGDSAPETLPQSNPVHGPIFVGRDDDLARLNESWHRALAGDRQVVFVSGEPGVGKTTTIDRFVASIDPSTSAVVGRGQCVELYGEGEAYLPVLEAVSRMCRGDGGSDLKQILRAYAPTWVVEMPGLIEPIDMEAARIVAASATQPRMLREMADVLELFAATRPVVLICEDLHLSDRSTIELLSYLAQRRGAARLLIIGTSRTVEMGPQARVLIEVVRELHSRRQCDELRLGLLGEAAVAEYLRRRIGSDAIPAGLAHRLYQRTGGNALFMVMAVEHLLARGADANAAVPNTLEQAGISDSVRQMIEKHLEMIAPADRDLLETASVAGAEFSAAALSAALDDDSPAAVEQVDQRCKDLARRTRFLDEVGVAHWPDGTITGRYRFHHALYQEVLYDRVGQARRIRLHKKIGERIEAGHGERADEIAAELAMHFERGGDPHRATKYLSASTETALHRSAYDTAIAHAQKGLALAATLPPGAEQLALELRLQLALGSALAARWGIAAPQVEKAYARAHELVTQIGETPAIVPVLLGMARFHLVRSEMDAAQALAEPCLRLAQSADDADLILEAHVVIGAILYSRGRFRESLAHYEQVIGRYDPRAHRLHALLYGLDPGVVARNYAALTLWRLGFADQARKRANEAVALGEQLAHAHSYSMALSAVASTLVSCRLWPATESWSEKLIAHAAEKELPFWHAWGEVFRGLAQAEQGEAAGVALIRSGLAAFDATGGGSRQSEVRSLLTRVRAGAMPPRQALQIAQAALTTFLANGELNDEAELRRIIGVLKLQDRDHNGDASAEAEACFLTAIETARRQDAMAYELRAVMDLARLWESQGKRAEARETLAQTYSRFSEGFDTGDLKEAQALIAELGQ